MTVTITPANTSELLARQYDDLRSAARSAMHAATQIAAAEVRHLAPGSISEHIDERVRTSTGMVTGSVFPTQDFAKYVDEGTGVYVEFHQPIRPLTARRLTNPRAALRMRSGAIRRSVRGQRPQRFMERGAELAEPRVETILEQPAVDVTRKLAG